MYLVVYPVDCKFERHSFDGYDWSVPEEAKKVFKELYTLLHNKDTFHYFNVSTTSRASRHNNLDDFTEMCNNEEISIEGSWTIWLNLTEADVMSVIEEYETDRLNTVGNGDEYYILTEDVELVDYPEEDFLLSYFDKVEAVSDLDDNEKLLLLKTSFRDEHTNIHTVYDSEGEHCFGSFERADGEDFNDYFRKFVAEKRDEIKKWYGI